MAFQLDEAAKRRLGSMSPRSFSAQAPLAGGTRARDMASDFFTASEKADSSSAFNRVSTRMLVGGTRSGGLGALPPVRSPVQSPVQTQEDDGFDAWAAEWKKRNPGVASVGDPFGTGSAGTRSAMRGGWIDGRRLRSDGEGGYMSAADMRKIGAEADVFTRYWGRSYGLAPVRDAASRVAPKLIAASSKAAKASTGYTMWDQSPARVFDGLGNSFRSPLPSLWQAVSSTARNIGRNVAIAANTLKAPLVGHVRQPGILAGAGGLLANTAVGATLATGALAGATGALAYYGSRKLAAFSGADQWMDKWTSDLTGQSAKLRKLAQPISDAELKAYRDKHGMAPSTKAIKAKQDAFWSNPDAKAAVDLLRRRPELSDAFEKKFGVKARWFMEKGAK